MSGKSRSGMAPRDHYAEVTEHIVAALERGARPWRRPWSADRAGGPLAPRNAVTGRRYAGVNHVLLTMRGMAFGADPRWLTYRQAAQRGWQVRRGERGTTVFLFRPVPVRAWDDEASPQDEAGRRTVPLLRAFVVFHASQVDGIDPFKPPPAPELDAIASVTVIAANHGVPIRRGGDRAYYDLTADRIQMPPAQAFVSATADAATLLHEEVHAAGHPSRLNRDLAAAAQSLAGRAFEELVAEIGSAMLGAELGLDTDLPNHASYIEHWLTALQGDRRAIFRAAAAAQRAADWLLALHPEHAARLAAERHAKADDEAEADTTSQETAR